VSMSAFGVQAHLHKLLVYPPGGHFKPHRDTEKEKGMFATLVIQLPSAFTGGKFLVRHGNTEVAVESDVKSADSFRYAAFFADCEHEIKEVTSGHRVALAYNVVRTARGGSVPCADTSEEPLAKLKAACEAWDAHRADTSSPVSTPELLCYPLEHQYTQASLSSFAGLKGNDIIAANFLSNAQGIVDVYVVQIAKTTTIAVYDYGEEEEVDSQQTLTWVSPTGPVSGSCWDFNAEHNSLDGSETFFDDEPDEVGGTEYTGNEGMCVCVYVCMYDVCVYDALCISFLLSAPSHPPPRRHKGDVLQPDSAHLLAQHPAPRDAGSRRHDWIRSRIDRARAHTRVDAGERRDAGNDSSTH
jgi:hypothetical protein